MPGSREEVGGFPKIPGYRIEGVLGRGSVAMVYRATQLAMNRSVALKVLHRDLMRDKKTAERLVREAQLAARFNHPNIVRAHDVGVHEGLFYYVMECVDGVSLKDILRRGPMEERRATDVVMQIAAALSHFHRERVVHRDIKPANILLTPTGQALLADLGLAKVEFDSTTTSKDRTVGTPQYMSPEQAVDPQRVDIRSDIFSLGATYYHLLTGVSPFDAPSVGAVITRILYEAPAPPRTLRPEISEAAEAVCMRMLEKDRSKRYRSPGLLGRDLAALVAGAVPIAARRAPNRHRIVAVGLAAVVLLATAVWWIVRPGSNDVPEPSTPRSTEGWRGEGPPIIVESLTNGELIALAAAEPSRRETESAVSVLMRRAEQIGSPVLGRAFAAAEAGDADGARRLIDEELPREIGRAFGHEIPALPKLVRDHVRGMQGKAEIEIAAIRRRVRAETLRRAEETLRREADRHAENFEYAGAVVVGERLRRVPTEGIETLDEEAQKDLERLIERAVERYQRAYEAGLRKRITAADALRSARRFVPARAAADACRASLGSEPPAILSADVAALTARIAADEKALSESLEAALERLDRFAPGGHAEWADRRFEAAATRIRAEVDRLPEVLSEIGKGEAAAIELKAWGGLLEAAVLRLARVREAFAKRAESDPIDLLLVKGERLPAARIAAVEGDLLVLRFADRPEMRVPLANVVAETFQEAAPETDPVFSRRFQALLAYADGRFLEVGKIQNDGGPDPLIAALEKRAEAAIVSVDRARTPEERAAFEAWNKALADYKAKDFAAARARLRDLMGQPAWTKTAWYVENKKSIVEVYDESAARADLLAAAGARRGALKVLDWKTGAVELRYDFSDAAQAGDFSSLPMGTEIGDGRLAVGLRAGDPAPTRVAAAALSVPLDQTASPVEIDFIWKGNGSGDDRPRCLVVSAFGRHAAILSRLRRSAPFRVLPLHGLEEDLGELFDIGATAIWSGSVAGYDKALAARLANAPVIVLDSGKSYQVRLRIEPKPERMIVTVDGSVVCEAALAPLPKPDDTLAFREAMPYEIRALTVRGVLRR